MKHNLLFIFCLCLAQVVIAQTNVEEALLSIENQEQAENFIEHKYAFNSKLITFNEEKHKTQLARTLFNLQKGQLFTTTSEQEKTIYKILDKTNITYYRVAYIVLDGAKDAEEHVLELRDKLANNYKKGMAFSALANQYSTDHNAKKGGDTGWFTSGDMHNAIENAVLSEPHQHGDLYTIDDTEKQQYYLVLQSHKPKEIAELKVLKIVEPVE